MYFSTILFLTVIVVASGFKCPDYCTCTDTFVTHVESKHVHAKCTKVDGLQDLIAPSKINAIDLSATNLSKLSTNFNSFKVLSELNLSNNELIEIPKLNNRITNLTLTHNQLTSSAITKLPLHVQYLDLAYNKITTVPKDMMRFNRLRKLELAGNPIDCNCESIKVRNWLAKWFTTSELLVTCATPKRFENRSWWKINEFDVCEFGKLKKIKILVESDNDLMFADQPNEVTPIEGSGNDDTTPNEPATEPILILNPTTVSIQKMALIPKSSVGTYVAMAKDFVELLPKTKSEDGKTEVYATSGAAGVIIIALTAFAVYKKHHSGGANIETGEGGEELKTIGGLELAAATELVLTIDKQVKAEESTNPNEKPAENIQDTETVKA